MEPSCPLGTTRCIPREIFPRKPYNKSFIGQVRSVKTAGYWPGSFFASLWTSTSSRSINTQKKELGQYPAILTSHLVNNPYLHDFFPRILLICALLVSFACLALLARAADYTTREQICNFRYKIILLPYSIKEGTPNFSIKQFEVSTGEISWALLILSPLRGMEGKTRSAL